MRCVLAVMVVCAMVAASGMAEAQEKLTPTVTGPGYVWWEGEDAVSHNFGPPDAFLSTGMAGICSKDAWLTASVQAAPAGGLLATWRIQVPEAGQYHLWARVGYRPWCSNQWRVDEGEWQNSNDDYSYFQMVYLAQNRPATWTLFGVLDLKAGVHTLQVRFPEGQRVLQAFDCFVLATRDFVPLGKFRPDEEIPVAKLVGEGTGGDWWPFQPAAHLGEKPTIDLSSMNEPAGAHGFVGMNGKDGDLQFADGTPVRFWGPNVSYHQGHGDFMTHADADHFADMLARLGVNVVRAQILHSANAMIDQSRDDTQHFDMDKVDRLDYLVAALHKRGIYLNLDLIYHRMFKKGDNIDEELVGSQTQDGYNVNWAAGSAALFHPRAIELNRELYKNFMLHTNRYTGKTWVDDPGIAMVTIQNEQSIFWGTTNVQKGHPRQVLNQLYTEWLRQKYGSQAYLATAWQVQGQPSPFNAGEDLDSSAMELGQVGVQSAPNVAKRGLDQIRFLYHVESTFYSDTIAAMRQWGVKCPIITSNWNGAGQTSRLVLQASALGEVVDRHHYSGNGLLLERIGSGTVGGAFEQVAGRAFSVSEWNANTDGPYTPEAVPLMATVAAFQGWDAMFQFCAGSSTWEPSLGGLGVTPGHYALYPAAAMIFRRGDIRAGDIVYERRRDPQFQFSFEPEKRGIPSELIAIGRVLNSYVGEPTPDLLRQDLVDKLWDKEHGVTHASTGQFDWHYGEKWLRLNAERTQGAFGALAGRKVECDDVSVETPNAFCAVIVSALEAKPIPQAGRLLVSAVGRSRSLPVPPAAGEAIPGRAKDMPPCLMEPVTGTVSVRTAATKVYAADALGYRLGEVEARRDGERLTFRMEGKPQVVFYEIAK